MNEHKSLLPKEIFSGSAKKTEGTFFTLPFLISGFLLFLIIFCCILAPILAPYSESEQDLAASLSPVFLNAILLMLLFVFKLRWFPAFGAGRGFTENLYYLCLPAFALSLNMVALIGRIIRDRMILEFKSSYALALSAKGTPFHRIVMTHCFKNTLIPVITVGGVQIGAMVIGAVLVENVFALGGIGALLIEGIQASDYPVVQSIMLFLVALFLVLNLIVDMVYFIIDPRIRASGNTGRA